MRPTPCALSRAVLRLLCSLSRRPLLPDGGGAPLFQWQAYLYDAWNVYDFVNLTTVLFVGVCRSQVCVWMRDVKRMIEEGDDGYTAQLMGAVGWADTEQTLLAISATLTFLKVLNYMSGIPRLGLLTHTLTAVRSWLLTLLAIAGILSLGFACAFTLTFGSQLRRWNSVGNSMVSLLEFTLGQADLESMVRINCNIARHGARTAARLHSRLLPPRSASPPFVARATTASLAPRPEDHGGPSLVHPSPD